MRRIPLEETMQGDWKVLKYMGNDGKKSWYYCECTCCGTRKFVRADKMKSKRSLRCIACSRFFNHN